VAVGFAGAFTLLEQNRSEDREQARLAARHWFLLCGSRGIRSGRAFRALMFLAMRSKAPRQACQQSENEGRL
jgi:hypothetical protein